MSWIIGIICFLVGAAAGALLFRIFRSDEVRVKHLEAQLRQLAEEHENYKGSVHTHFSGTARLLNELTDNYRKVCLHMANSAQSLCPDYISSQLSLSNEAKALLDRDKDEDNQSAPVPPLDYAARSSASRRSSLAEDYGIDRSDQHQ
ncbi:MAG: YhcB family protein [Pseudohongiellaceae bacterium]